MPSLWPCGGYSFPFLEGPSFLGLEESMEGLKTSSTRVGLAVLGPLLIKHFVLCYVSDTCCRVLIKMGLCISLSHEPDPAIPVVASSSTTEEAGGWKILETPNLKKFSFKELKIATENFNINSLLGEGESGKFFMGWMDEKALTASKVGTGMTVAIKKFNSESLQDFPEWQAFGICCKDKELLLVYEHLQRGSWEDHLFQSNLESLSWDIRQKIAIGVARGLAFVQSVENTVRYWNFKASNILLDGKYNAKVSIGLAKLERSSSDCRAVIVQGSYAAPEYIQTGHLGMKNVVYSFGVVLLDMLTGLRAFDSTRPNEQKSLVNWRKPCLSSKRMVKAMMDTWMDGQYSSVAALQAAQLTLKCLASDHKIRPSMKEVVEVLEEIAVLV